MHLFLKFNNFRNRLLNIPIFYVNQITYSKTIIYVLIACALNLEAIRFCT
jgi:hypothetical protein